MRFLEFLRLTWYLWLPYLLWATYGLGKENGKEAAHKQMDQDAFLKAYREMCKSRYGI